MSHKRLEGVLMTDIIKALQIWRNLDQEDSFVLSRHEIIVLLTEIERLNAENKRLNWLLREPRG
jgi:hypothetical protein